MLQSGNKILRKDNNSDEMRVDNAAKTNVSQFNLFHFVISVQQ